MKIKDVLNEERTFLSTLARHTVKASTYTDALEALKRMIEKYPEKSPYSLAGEIQRLSNDAIEAHELIAMWDDYISKQ